MSFVGFRGIMKQLILIIFATMVVLLSLLNPRIIFHQTRPIYIISCRTEWSAHWWGAFTHSGLIGLYSIDNAAKAMVEKNIGINYVPESEKISIAISSLLEHC